MTSFSPDRPERSPAPAGEPLLELFGRLARSNVPGVPRARLPELRQEVARRVVAALARLDWRRVCATDPTEIEEIDAKRQEMLREENLHGALRNALRTSARRRRPVELPHDDEGVALAVSLAPEHDDPADAVAEADARVAASRTLGAVLRGLEDEHRCVLAMTELFAMPHWVVGITLGLSENAVAQKKGDALNAARRLAPTLGTFGGESIPGVVVVHTVGRAETVLPIAPRPLPILDAERRTRLRVPGSAALPRGWVGHAIAQFWVAGSETLHVSRPFRIAVDDDAAALTLEFTPRFADRQRARPIEAVSVLPPPPAAELVELRLFTGDWLAGGGA